MEAGLSSERIRRVWKVRREPGEKAEGTVKRGADNQSSSIIGILAGEVGNNLCRRGQNDSQP